MSNGMTPAIDLATLPRDPSGRYAYTEVPFPALPDILFPVAIDLKQTENGRHLAFFNVRAVCEGIDIDPSRQQTKIQRPGGKYEGLWRMVPFYTIKGWRDTVALEFDGVGLWIINLQEGKLTVEQREFLLVFRKLAMKLISQLLLTPPATLPGAVASFHTTLPPPPARRSSRDARLDWLIERVDQQEDTIALLANGKGTLDTRVGYCPHCGQPIRLEVGSYRFVPAVLPTPPGQPDEEPDDE